MPSKVSATRRGNAEETARSIEVQVVYVVLLFGSQLVPALVALTGSTLRRASLSSPLYGTLSCFFFAA